MSYPGIDIVSCDFDKDGLVTNADIGEILDRDGQTTSPLSANRKFDVDFNGLIEGQVDGLIVNDRLGLNIDTIRSNIKTEEYTKLTWPNGWEAWLSGVNANEVYIQKFMGSISAEGELGWITVHKHIYSAEYDCDNYAADEAIAAYKALGYGNFFLAFGGAHGFQAFWIGGDWTDLNNWRLLSTWGHTIYNAVGGTGNYKIR
ncbi:unnamed protein product, partial [marine sediment metagenome]